MDFDVAPPVVAIIDPSDRVRRGCGGGARVRPSGKVFRPTAGSNDANDASDAGTATRVAKPYGP